MESPNSHQYTFGETLPLFEAPDSPSAQRAATPGRTRVSYRKQDGHMQAAWRLARALKAAKSGHKAGRDVAKLSPGQRHQVGTAICEHLLASLRQQVQSEHQVSEH